MAERKKFENIKREEFETTINTINQQIENFKKELKENNEKMNEWNRNIQENLKNNNDKLDIILQALKSNKYESDSFKSKYECINELDDFKYLDEINDDEQLNKKILYLKPIKTFFDNFDSEISKSKELLDNIKSKIKDIDAFNNDLNDLLKSHELLDTKNKNDLIQKHKSTFDFYDRPKVKELDIDETKTINEFIDSFNGLDSIFDKHNDTVKAELQKKELLDSVEITDKFFDKLDSMKSSGEFISAHDKSSFSLEFGETYDLLNDSDLSDFDGEVLSKINEFLDTFSNLDNIIEEHNDVFQQYRMNFRIKFVDHQRRSLFSLEIKKRGDLITNGFSRACRHDGQKVPPAQQGVYGLALSGAERLKAPVLV